MKTNLLPKVDKETTNQRKQAILQNTRDNLAEVEAELFGNLTKAESEPKQPQLKEESQPKAKDQNPKTKDQVENLLKQIINLITPIVICKALSNELAKVTVLSPRLKNKFLVESEKLT